MINLQNINNGQSFLLHILISFSSFLFVRSRGMEYPVGLRLRPTDEEIFDDYLRPKNLNSNTRDVDEVISTVTIRSFDPWELPSQSRIKLKDQVWYFFSRKENKYERGERQIRKTKSGYWKITGKPKDINRKGQKIGYKRVLVFHLSNGGSKSDWVMHEYHLLSPNQVMMTYTICKVMFKGDERDISSSSSSSAGSEIVNTHSSIPLVNNYGGSEVVQSSIPHDLNNSGGSEVTQSLIPHDLNNSGALSTETEGSSFHSQELQNPLHSSGLLDAEEWRNYLVDDEQMNTMFLQDDRNDYRPQKSLTGVFTDDSSDDNDSVLISATTNSIRVSSTCDSFGSSNHRTDQITTLHESPNSTIKLLSLTQEVSQALRTSIDTSETKNPNDDAQGTEIGEHKMDQKTIKNKRAGFFYMIQKFVKKIQLCSSISRE